jgi:hypothetical protein
MDICYSVASSERVCASITCYPWFCGCVTTAALSRSQAWGKRSSLAFDDDDEDGDGGRAAAPPSKLARGRVAGHSMDFDDEEDGGGPSFGGGGGGGGAGGGSLSAARRRAASQGLSASDSECVAAALDCLVSMARLQVRFCIVKVAVLESLCTLLSCT